MSGMSSRAPLSLHTDLYRYWASKRADRAMPARRDIDPPEIPKLLPYLTLIDRVEGKLRYRLVGTEVSQAMGRDLTGSFVGNYVSPPEYAATILAIYERIFAEGQPLFTAGEYRSQAQTVHSVSRLIVPLGNDGRQVDMVLITRVARFRQNMPACANWLRGAPGHIRDIVDIGSYADAEACCAEWERQCAAEDAAAAAG
jgi:hypothetical protein